MENSDLLLLLFGILIILVFIMGLFFSTPQSSQDNESYSDEGKKEEVKKDGEQEPKQEAKPTPKQSIKRDDDKEINKKIFLENQKFLEDNDNDDPLYIKVLFETGLLYEKLYKDYFRGACYLYLTTLLEPSNEEYEKQYIRLCKTVREKKVLNGSIILL